MLWKCSPLGHYAYYTEKSKTCQIQAQLVSQCIQLFLQEYSGIQYMLYSIDNICGIMMMTTKKYFNMPLILLQKEEEEQYNMALLMKVI